MLLDLGTLEIGIGKQRLALMGDGGSRCAGHILAEELGDVGGQHLQHLIIATEPFLLADRVIELIAPHLAGDQAAEILDPRGPMDLGPPIKLGKDTGHGNVRQVHDHPMHIVENLGPIRDGGGLTSPDIHLTGRRHAAARDVAGLSGRLAAVAALELVEMGIVDDAVEDIAGAPGEAGVA